MRRLLASILCLTSLALALLSAPAAADDIDWPAARRHWSFQPLQKPTPPTVNAGSWARNPIDAFVLADLEAAGLKPAPPADAYTLLRRATFDLTGLPPTVSEIEAFVRVAKNGASPVAKPQAPAASDASAAFDAVLDRLLASPHYGERYGRHWLDVARYEQGKVKLKGVVGTRGELDYRDYVIRAFNQDKPFNQFIVEQLAGDLLPAPANVETDAAATQQYFDQFIATAFLSIGPWFDECTDPNRLRLDMIDEMLTTTGKAFLGLNFNCARCHDHKYDPIPTRDYYALAGIFRSTRVVDVFNEEWKDGRLRLTRELVTPREANDRAELIAAINKNRELKYALIERVHAKLVKQWPIVEKKVREITAALPPSRLQEFEAEEFAGVSDIKASTIQVEGKAVTVIETQSLGDQWVKYAVSAPADGSYTLEALGTLDEPAGFVVEVNDQPATQPFHTFGYGWDWKFRRWIHVTFLKLKAGPNTIRLRPASQTERFPRVDRFRWYPTDDDTLGNLILQAKEHEIPYSFLLSCWKNPKEPIPNPLDISMAMTKAESKLFDKSQDLYLELKQSLHKVDGVLTVADFDAPTDLPIHQRGETYRPGDAAIPRGVIQLFEHALPSPKIAGKQSGRLELARWLTDAKHPLTARVIANRVWQWHFGVGLVDTPNDFGVRGNPPATENQRKLLDWLACELIEHNWSLKHLHRVIMSSAAYSQESGVRSQETEDRRQHAEGANSEPGRVAPTNLRAITMMPRRLEVEAIYDAMAATTGKIPRQSPPPTGDGEQPVAKPITLDLNKSGDRMIYVLSNGRSPAGLGEDVRKMFAVFGYDPSGESLPVRDASTTSAQALFWLNSPLPKHFAGEFARALLKNEKQTETRRLAAAYRAALGRPPHEAEAQAMLVFLKTCEERKLPPEEAWKRVCLALYSCSEFRYVE